MLNAFMSKNENSKGNYRTTREKDLRAYEKLPPTLRQALRDAAFNYAPQPILTRWRRGMAALRS